MRLQRHADTGRTRAYERLFGGWAVSELILAPFLELLSLGMNEIGG